VFFAAIGYGYILIVLAWLGLAVGLAATNAAALGGGARLVAWLAVGLFGVVASSLIVRIPPPSGIDLTRETAPRLFDLLDGIRTRLGTPPIDRVLVSSDLNSSVVELRKFGLVGPWTRYLTIGLPLLEGLGAETVSGILAHECAHLAIGHSRTHVWLVRLGNTWQRLMWSLEVSGHWGAIAFRSFFRWYAPRFQKAVSQLSRSDEFTSDAAAARVVDEQTVAAGLLQLHTAQRLLDRGFWWKVYTRSQREPLPPKGVFLEMAAFLRTRRPEIEAGGAVRWVLDERTQQDHTHPSLRDRLRALGVLLPEWESATGALPLLALDRNIPASATLIAGDRLDETRRAVEADWIRSMEPPWARWAEDAKLAAGIDSHPLEASRAQARWATACSAPDEAIAEVRSSIASYGAELSHRLLLGRLLVVHDDKTLAHEGVLLLEGVMATESIHSVEAASLLQGTYARRDEWSDVARCRDRSAALLDLYRRHSAERHRLSAKDQLAAWPAPEIVLRGLAKRLSRHPEVDRAFLLRKVTRRFREQPLVILALECRVSWYRSSAAVVPRVVQKVAHDVWLPGEDEVLVFGLEPRSLLRRRCRRLPGAVCYERGSPLPDRTRITGQPSDAPFGYHLVPGVRGAIATILVLSLATILVLGGTNSAAGPESPEEYARALPELQAEARAAPNDFEAQYELAWAYLQLERWDEAITQLEKSRRLDSTNPWVWGNLGWVLANQERWYEAIPPLEKAVSLDPQFGDAFLTLGWALFRTEQNEDAIAANRKGLAIFPKRAGGHHVLGLSHFRLDQPAQALTALREANRLEPEDPAYLRSVLDAATRLHRYHEARAAAKSLVRMDSTISMAWGLLAEASYMTGREREAAAALRRVMGVEPEFLVNHPQFLVLHDALRDAGFMDGMPAPIALIEPLPSPEVRDSFERQDSLNQALTEETARRIDTGNEAIVRLTSNIHLIRLRVGEEFPMARLRWQAWDVNGREIRRSSFPTRFVPDSLVAVTRSGFRAVRSGQGSLIVAVRSAELVQNSISPRRLAIRIEILP
jgi:tetratricopeptide (TPR) repeat protein/Zn-dependent protease with chaperone function